MERNQTQILIQIFRNLQSEPTWIALKVVKKSIFYVIIRSQMHRDRKWQPGPKGIKDKFKDLIVKSSLRTYILFFFTFFEWVLHKTQWLETMACSWTIFLEVKRGT